jgi:hypothetical protein
MSDADYQKQAERRARLRWIGAAVAAALVLAVLGGNALFRDTCTGGYDRDPQAVVAGFAQAVTGGDWDRVSACWERNAFYSLDSGCSEVCLSRLLGTAYEVVEIELGEPFRTDAGRTRVWATATVRCVESGEEEIGDLLLDTVGAKVPWRHWKIVESTFGGPLSDPWCK